MVQALYRITNVSLLSRSGKICQVEYVRVQRVRWEDELEA
jgi:hypothetical protein